MLYLCYVAGSWGLADVYARPAMNLLGKWKKGQVELKDEDWNRLRGKLSKALKLDPGNPDIHQWLGLAIEGPYARFGPGLIEAVSVRQRAADHYRESIRLRPVWPYAWVDLALAKYRLGEIDAEFYRALHTSIELGPWEPGVQKVVADIGMHLWDNLPKEERLFILDTIKHALLHSNRSHVNQMLKLVKQRGFLQFICLIVKNNNVVENYCGKELKKS
ncbi:MAG: tetratricopeptide repeat protein [Gammaproteobacteria bacterium]